MAQDYSIRLTGDSTQLQKTLDDAQQKFVKITSSTQPLKRRLAEVKKLMAEMNLKGLSNTDVFQQLAQEAGRYADAIGDAQTATRVFADDNLKLTAMAQGFQAITGSASVLTGALGMLGVENEKVQQTMLKVQSAIAMVNGVTAIANVLNKDSALMLRLKQIRMLANTAATKANAVAESTGTVATTAGTAATAANTVATTVNTAVRNKLNMAIAIGKALMGDWTGLVLVGAAALTTYAIATSGSTDKLEENANTVNYSKKVVKEYSEELGRTINKSVSRVKELSTEFRKLKDENSKTEWINRHKSELDSLGISVNDLINIDREFRDENSKVITALEDNAKATLAAKKRNDDYSNAVATNCGNLVGKFQSLKREWDALQSTAEKTKWLQANQTAFANLGMSIYDLTTAENVFTNNTARVVKALEARAKAMAAQNLMTDEYAKYYKQKKENASTVKGGGMYLKAKEGQTITKDQSAQILKELKSYTVNGEHLYNDGYFTEKNGTRKLTEKGANALNAQRQQDAVERRKANDQRAETELNKNLDFLAKEAEKASQEISKLGLDKVVRLNSSADKSGKSGESTGSKSGGKSEKIDYLVSVDDGTLETAEKKLQAFAGKKKQINIDDTEALDKCQRDIDKWQKEVIYRKIAIEGDDSVKATVSEIQELTKQLDNLDDNAKIADIKNKLLIDNIKIGIVPEIESGSTVDIENRIKQIENVRKILLQTQADPESIKKIDDEIKALKKELEAEKIRIGIIPKVDDNSINAIRKRISEKEEEINLALNTDIDPDSMKKLQDELESLRKQESEKSIEIGITKNVATISKQSENWGRGSVEDKRDSLSNAESMVREIQENYRLKLIGKDEVESQLADINAKLEELNLQPIELTFNDDGTLTTASENLERYKTEMSAVSDMAGNMGSVFGSLGSAIGGTTGEVMNFAGQSINAIAQIIPQIVSMIAAKEAEAIAGGTASAASMPFPANIAAIAGIVATIAGIFASLPKFESGGIVGGSSFTGDKLLARVNSGEMILNKTQQKNLYNSMTSAEIGTPMQNTLKGDVNFTISGSALKGALKNYDSKMSKIK